MVQAATDATRGKSPTSASKLYDRLSSILHWVKSSLGDSPITWIHTRGPPYTHLTKLTNFDKTNHTTALAFLMINDKSWVLIST